MPIYEYKCLKCQEYFEMLVMSQDEELELRCPKCKSEEFERVISTTNYSMDTGSGAGQKASVKTRECSTGSCTTYDIPGLSR
ncbi:MAG: zinc ribbon domain-containing protein [Desulfobacteraceae bacterium]|nr:zinc ribbon domain-containing protein [Desulfobacteraceae bacterium]